ncbi:hypothetical protein AQUCO_01000221v1 [Aquilegia coerulea]|uniref:KIB1-4 beta-propeller domain-containing protein n=1 Tax=Aquilegia coerulea TaxID=218851 RepID=A0A2G5E8U5_AQUCA|nr:hypothetical protein AQUCO_01000221v1 [Aquilegia coerulea]
MDFDNIVESGHQAVQFLPQPSSDLEQDIDWLELPDHGDYIRFSAVSHVWHSVAIQNRHLTLARKPPLLMLATELNNDDQTHSFYSLTENKVVDFCLQVPHNLYMRGSSHGWLAMVSNNWEITLYNPFLSVNNKIQLPPATAFEPRIDNDGDSVTVIDFDDYMKFVSKVVLSDNPASNPNYVVMAIYGDYCLLAFYKPGDKAWTSIDSKLIFIEDVIYYDDQFYFVDHKGNVFSCDLNQPQPRVSTVSPVLQGADKRYLVESCGELWQVSRYTIFPDENDINWESDNPMDYRNAKFDVFKLDRVAVEWIKMDNLQGCVFFLGDNSSYSVWGSDCPECKPNSIYYTDDYYEGYHLELKNGLGPHDMGVFNLQEGTHEPHYPTNSKMLIPAPIWIERTL